MAAFRWTTIVLGAKPLDAPALEAARARIRAAGLGGDPVEIEHAARAYAAAVRRGWLAAAARCCAAALKTGARRRPRETTRLAPRGGSGS